MSSHLIHRQELEILISDKSRAREAQDRIAALNQGTWLPVITKTMDRLYGPDKWVQLDRIEIDIGVLAHYSSAALERKLEESLISGLKVAERENRIQSGKLSNKSSLDVDFELDSETEDPVLFYLRTGSRKWSTVSSINLQSQLKYRILSLKNFDSLKKIHIEVGDAILDRTARVLQLEDIPVFLNNLTHQPSYIWTEWLTKLSELSQGILSLQKLALNKKMLEKICLRKALTMAFDNRENYSTWDQKMENLQIIWLRKILIEHGFDFRKITKKTVKNSDVLMKMDAVLDELTPKIFEQDLENKTSKPGTKPKSKLDIPEEGLLCLNAGISLIWPYLPAFFKAKGWVQDKRFTSTKNIDKAMLCLHFMATGKRLQNESEATMYKLMCGLDFNSLFDLRMELSESSKEDANELLQNVIQNWKVLKGTSIQGLREGWLQRSGRLKSEQNGYVIEMETSAIDILLDKVTWPISTIMLPWNKKIIHVKWK